VGTAAVSGIGQYDVNVTDYVNAIKSGTQVAFLVKQLNEADEVVVHSSPLVSTLGSCVKGNKVSTTLTAAPDGTKSLKIHKFSSSTWYPNDQFYQNFAVLFTNSEIIKSGELVEEDIGRTFRISFRIYDTTSRIISVQMASLSTYSVLFPDYNVSYYNVYTKAGEWVEVSFDHTVYEPLYADKVGYKTQKLTVYAPLEGSEMNPIYLSDVKSCEIFTDVTLEKAELLLGTTDQRVNPLATEYGMIPEKYADAATYPFVIFDENKNCISATSSFHGSNGSGGAMGVVKDYVKNAYKDGSYATGKTAYVLMRRDYTFTTTEYYNNLAQIQGTAYIDLGGHTLSAGSTAKPMLAISSKGYSGAAGEKVFPTSLIFSNGTMLANNHGIMTLSTWDSVGDGSIVNKDFNLTFNGVTFGITSTSTSAELMTLVSNPSATSVAAPFNLTYNDCTFDLRTVAPKSTISIFTTVTEGKYVKITTAINGGKILTDNPELVTVLETGTNNYGSSVNFGKGSDSEYVKYVVPEGKTVGADTYLSGGVKLHFVKGATTDGYTVYELEEAPLTSDEFTTPYGVIPEKYSSVTSYPFVIFDGNKNCIGAHANLLDITSSYDNAGALHIAKNYLSKNNYWDGESYGSSPATAYIVMRRDYTMASTEQYNNIAQVQGLITIDLNGFTLTADQSRTLFPATSKQWSGSGDADYFHASQFKFTNGSIVAYDKAIVTYSCTCTELKTFDISFEDIDFKALGTAQSFILDYASSGKTSYPNISFSNCTFDITESKATGSVILFNLGKSLMQANFTVSGCSVIAGDTDFTLFLKPSDVNGTLTFSKGDNGKYLEIKVNSDVAPEGTFNNGELGFVQTNGDGDTFVYTLAPVGLNSFVPKASITLGSELVYNIYVPVVDFLKSFTVDGVSYEDLIPVTLDNGISYYRIEVPMGASEAARNIVLEAVLTVGDNEHVGTWTMSIPKYAKKVVESDTTGVEIDLVKDVLSYIRAAYAYFDKTDEEKMALIDSILGENYDTSNAPVLNGSSIAPSEGLKSVTYILNARPTVRFHITGEADSYAFYVDGTELKTTVGSDDSGTYIDTDIYAYAMAETITYTIDGVESGSYHINSYYTFVTTDEEHRDDAELINLVLRFAKYCESAAEYRKFVRGDYGSMTITAPSEIYSNYPAKDLNISFSGADYNGTVTYTTDNENVFVENGKIYATGTFASEVTVTVTAKTRYHVATATVKVSTYNGSISAETKIQYYEENIIKEENKGGMIFVGDSYVDGYKMEAPPFWRDFYRDFAGEKAFLMGLSSSQIHQLEIASERIVYPMEPSEIVVNIGHNDLHHGSLTVDQFVERLTALFYEYHERLPEAKIYFISVAPKKIAETNADRFVSSFEKVPAANAAIKALAEQYDWLYYVDTTDIFYSYGENLVNTNMFPGNDNSHPSLVAYDLMKIALDEVRGVTRSDVAYIDNDLRAITYTDKDGKNITGDFAASGKLVITQYVPGSNVYVHFRLHQSYRFVLWDSNGDGKHGAGYLGGGTVKDTTSGVTLYDGKEGLVLNWAVITKTEGDIHKAYWYINGQLMHTFESYTPAYFLIGGENANSLVYDVELSVKADNEAAYNEHVARYADDVINLETYGYGPLTNKVLTDEGGSTLTDNYIIKGKLNISDFPKDNTYIQFVVGSGNRFLLWDSNNDSKLGAGYTENGTNYSDKSDGITLYDAKEGLTLDWAIVVNGDVASFYLNGELIKELTVTERSEFKVGASQMNVTLSDIEIYTQATDETAYNNALSEYIG